MRFFLLLFLNFYFLVLSAQVQIGSTISGEAANDSFGSSVSFSSNGKRIAIGAPGNDGNGVDAGHVRILEEIGGVWTQVGNDILGEAANDSFGSSVSFSSDGTRVAIGAFLNDANGENSGHVKILEENDGNWMQIGSSIEGESDYDYSGYSVSLSSDGTRVAIGAYNSGDEAGQVKIYDENNGIWMQVGMDIEGEALDWLGYSVSLSSNGKRIAIGAPYSLEEGGYVKIYEDYDNVWTQIGSNIIGDINGYLSGHSVSLSLEGTRVAMITKQHIIDGVAYGLLKTYEESDNTWMQVGGDIIMEGLGAGVGSPISLSSDGKLIVVGAFWDDENGNNTGKVRIFKENENTWILLGEDINGDIINSWSGHSVSLSSDNTRVAIGAPYGEFGEDSARALAQLCLKNNY